MLDTAMPPASSDRSAPQEGGTLVEDHIVGVGKKIDEINDEDVVTTCCRAGKFSNRFSAM